MDGSQADSNERLIELTAEMCDIARKQGALALEPWLKEHSDLPETLQQGVRRVIDGAELKMINELLANRFSAKRHELAVEERLIYAAVACLNESRNPRQARELLHSIADRA